MAALDGRTLKKWANAKVGDKVSGKTTLGTPVSGTIVEVKPGIGAKLDNGKFLSFAASSGTLSSEKLPASGKEYMRRWMREDPGTSTKD